MKRALLLGACVLLACTPADRTTVPATPGTPQGRAFASATTLDTIKVPFLDSVKVLVYRDSTFTSFRDSIVIVPPPPDTIVPPPDTVPTPPDTIVPPPPPPPSVGVDTVGFKQIELAEFNTQNDQGAGPVAIGTWAPTMSVMTDATGTFARYTYYKNMPGGRTPGNAVSGNIQSRGITDVYLRMSYRYSANFINPPANVGKNMLLGFGENGNQFILGPGNYGGGAKHTYHLGWQGMGSLPTSNPVGNYNSGSGTITGCPAHCYSTIGWNTKSSGAIKLGSWETIEMRFHSGAPGTRSSWGKLWVDGKLVAHTAGFDIVWPGKSPALSVIKWYPVWGGGPFTYLNPKVMTLDLDHVYVSGK